MNCIALGTTSSRSAFQPLWSLLSLAGRKILTFHHYSHAIPFHGGILVVHIKPHSIAQIFGLWSYHRKCLIRHQNGQKHDVWWCYFSCWLSWYLAPSQIWWNRFPLWLSRMSASFIFKCLSVISEILVHLMILCVELGPTRVSNHQWATKKLVFPFLDIH